MRKPTPAEVAARFATKYVANDATGCHEWTGKLNRYGYGLFSLDRKWVGAHRYAYELARGPIPDGLQIDHLCRNRACVNVAHMEAVTSAENTKRAVEFWPSVLQTHCKNGHEFTAENTYRPIPNSRRRHCRTCNRARSAAYKARKVAS